MRLDSKHIGAVVAVFVLCAVLLPMDVLAQDSSSAFTTGPGPAVVVSSPAVTSPLATANPQASQPVNEALGDFCAKGTSWAVCMAGVIYWIAVGLGSSIAYVCAYFFDITVRLSLDSAAYALTFTSTGWTTARDLANMAFIFILLYIAFTVMFRAETTNTLKNLAAVIVVALLVNFSFFFTRVVIDAGNILAVQFYNAIDVRVVSGPAAGTAVVGNTKDLTAPIMDAVRVQNLINSQSFNTLNSKASNSVGDWFFVFLTLSLIFLALGIMFVVLAASFLFAGVKFLMRIVGLWFVIIASPLAFAARALPGNATAMNLYTQWRSYLVSFTFYPAVYLFIFYIIVQFMKALSASNLVGSLSGATASVASGSAADPGSGTAAISAIIAEIAVRVGIISILLFLAFVIADKIIKTGNQMAGYATGKVFGAAAGVLGFAGRKSMGWGMNRLSQSSTIATGAAQKGLRGTLWRGTERTAERLASATYDVRNAPGGGLVQKVFERRAKETGAGIDTGKAMAEGFAQQAKAAKERDDKERKERAAIIRDASNKDALKRIEDDKRAGRAHDPKDVDRIKNLNKREVEALKSTDIENVLHIISKNQLKTLNESDKFTDEEKEKHRLGWHEKNAEAPLVKAQKILANELRTLGASISAASTGIRGFSLATVSANSRTGHHMDGASVVAMKNEIKGQMAVLDSEIRKAPRATGTKDLHEDRNKLKDALKKVEDLENERKEVPADVGGHVNQGEFIVS